MTKSATLKDTTVLVTGGLGFIGSNFAARCVQEGARVRLLDCELPGSGANSANIDEFTDSVELVRGDVRNPDVMTEAIRDVDLVLHCAAQTSHTRAMKEAMWTLDINVRGTLQLLESVRHSGRRPKIVHVGTTTQLGPMIREPLDELHPEFPRDAYSATMVASEKLILIYANSHRMRATCLRLCNTYGPRAAVHSPDLGFVNYFVGLGLQQETITIFGDGKQLRSLLYIDDAVDALVRTALFNESDGQVYQVSSNEALTVSEIAEGVASCVGGEVKYVPWPEERQLIEVGDAAIDSSKIRRSLGWQPEVDLHTGLSKTAEFYRTRLDDYLPRRPLSS